MKFTATVASVTALMAALPMADAFFRISCGGPLLRERSVDSTVLEHIANELPRADPVVNPGGVSSHLHNIVGGNGFDFNMTYAKTIAATCTTCKVTQDKSNYWIVSRSCVDGGSGVGVIYCLLTVRNSLIFMCKHPRNASSVWCRTDPPL